MIIATFQMALRAIARNALRSFLTVLGIVIGTGSVVALVTIGQGATEQVKSEIGALGHNLLMVRPGADRRRGEAAREAEPFDLDDVQAIEQEVPGVEYIAPSNSSNALLVQGNRNWSASVTGTTNQYLSCRRYEIDRGRVFRAAEERGGNPVCLIGATVVEELFGSRDPVGERIRAGRISCAVIGTLKEKGEAAMGMDQDNIVLVPIRAFQRRIAGDDDVSNISISVADGRSSSLVKAQIESLLRQRRKVLPNRPDDFTVRDIQEIATAVQGTTQVLTALLGAIAAVSLLVGGIGIMNIMLVSVTERTREIGIRLAIGALGREVLWQFLVEASVLSGIGGVVGLLLGVAGAYAATRALELPFVVMPEVAVLAFGFSVLVGALFGFLPARKAARLDPVEALRYE
jgi:putative ABC transport system permease protein